jgi:hypothetical protein
LAKYAEWLLTLRAKKYTVIDLHAATRKHLTTMRKEDPAYRVANDGIHPNANGHLVLALEILKAWNAPTAVKDIKIDVKAELARAPGAPPAQPGVNITSVRRNGVAFKTTLPHPMPADPAWTERVKEVERFDERVNRYSLKVEGLGGFLAIRIGDPKTGLKRVPIRADQIAKGTDLARVVNAIPDPKGAEIWKRIAEKNRILGLAWLTHVGHKRPNTPIGLPFEEARQKAAVLDRQIRKLCAPEEINIGIGPFGK